MPIAMVNSIRTLAPSQFGIQLRVKIIDWLVTVETTMNDETIEVSEYLVGDQSGCIMLKTNVKGCSNGQWLDIKNGYTQVVNGSLRLVVDNKSDISMVDTDTLTDHDIDTSYNASFIEFLVKH
ncbi:uncharacterized protein BX664DRAFT_324616 [Halteromyces radiatus]|uniref:uncharacterized protein n=1 Tax=Halteromyces radiatus TaxID=101107 RepID=UPI00222034FF|nr:uncharacterized protein BX664DRAFT_324616 [Halteromyces radiatus]KAI8096693.1 hypothetical protein BX664DRAFT_324616 [Halteromyces radiatus]